MHARGEHNTSYGSLHKIRCKLTPEADGNRGNTVNSKKIALV